MSSRAGFYSVVHALLRYPLLRKRLLRDSLLRKRLLRKRLLRDSLLRDSLLRKRLLGSNRNARVVSSCLWQWAVVVLTSGNFQVTVAVKFNV